MIVFYSGLQPFFANVTQRRSQRIKGYRRCQGFQHCHGVGQHIADSIGALFVFGWLGLPEHGHATVPPVDEFLRSCARLRGHSLFSLTITS